jgi:6-phospho-beta-glucosidase
MLVKAFQINPLIRHGRASAEMLKEMLVANEKYLPQFKEKIQELKAEGIVIHDEKVRELCEQSL